MNNVIELSQNEMMEIDGGIVWLPVLAGAAIVAGTIVVAAGVGYAAGYIAGAIAN
jgi:hypothetical protein